MWYINDLSSTTAQPIRTRTNLVFMLNAQKAATEGICNVYTANSDTNIKIVSAGSGTYRLQLNSTSNRYLTAVGTEAGSDVNWQTLNSSSNTQKWKIVKLDIPAYPKASIDYTYNHITSGTVPFYLITVDASKVGVVNVVKQNGGIPIPYCGCNAGYFSLTAGKLGSLNMALNYGVPVGPEFTDDNGLTHIAGDYNSTVTGSWNIAYCDKKICFEQARTAPKLIEALGGSPVWAQGGITLSLGKKNWVTVWNSETNYSVDGEREGRTFLVANKTTNKVYLFVQQTGEGGATYSVRQFRNTIQQYLGISDGNDTDFVGIALDGGGSSCLRCYNSEGTRIGIDVSRPLCQIIYIKP